MVPYIENDMNHLTRRGGTFRTSSNGIGDVRLVSMWRLYAIESPSIGAHKAHVNFGVGFPTGSIDAEDQTPAGRTNPSLSHAAWCRNLFYRSRLWHIYGERVIFPPVSCPKDLYTLEKTVRDYAVGNRFCFKFLGSVSRR